MSAVSQGHGKLSNLLELPPEVLLEIVKSVHETSQSRKTGHYWQSVTLFYHQDAALHSLAEVSRYLRELCIGVGLYRRVQLLNLEYRPRIEWTGHSLFRQLNGTMRCMEICLNREVDWPIYENFLHVFPRTEELSFYGRLWDDVGANLLSDSIKGFQGTSLDIRCDWDSPFNKFLSRLSLEKITSLNINDGTGISEYDDYNELPIFPSLQKLRFKSEKNHQQEQARYVKLLMREAPITQLEIEYGTRPKCAFRYGIGAVDDRSFTYLRVRPEIYEGLRGVRDTLQVYIDQNSLGGVWRNERSYPGGTFHEPIFANEAQLSRVEFGALKILVYKCGSLNWLVDDKAPWGMCKFNSEFSSLPRHHHSGWRYLASEYKIFSPCECLFLHASTGYPKQDFVQPTTLGPDFDWKSFFDNAAANLWPWDPALQGPTLRYLIVGNERIGYRGIEPDLDKLRWSVKAEDKTMPYWDYQEILPEKCKSLLSARLSGIWEA